MNSRRSRRRAITFLLAVFAAATGVAQELPRWERIGTEGGSICALAAAPSKPAVVYAGGADAGVFRSADRGLSWSFAGRDLGVAAVCSLAVDARHLGRVWALADGKLYRSDNGGRRWLPLDTPLQQLLWGVVAHPTRSGLIFTLGNFGVRRSSDGGVTWSEPLDGLPVSEAYDLVFDPARPDHVFAATGQGLFRSLDGGRRWTAIDGGLPETFGYPQILALDSRGARTLYAASGSGQLYRSPDSGSTWKKTALPANVAPIALALQGRSLYVASFDGLWVSRDGGHSFSPAATRLAGQRVADVAALPYGVLASTPLGIYRSPDGGATFAPSQHGLRARSWSELEIDSRQPDDWYALDRNESLLRSANAGASWRKTGRELLALDLLAPPSMLVLDPVDSRLFTNLATIDAGGLLAGSADRGRSWEVLAGFGCLEPHWLFSDAERRRLLVGGHFLIGACGLLPGSCAVYRSLDDGASYACAKALLPAGGGWLALHRPSGDLLASSSTGLVRSADWGEHWTLVHPASPVALVVSPADPDLFYALRQESDGQLRLTHSTDQGLTWAPLAGTPPGNPIADPFDRQRLYALAPQQLYLSEDYGVTWQLLGGATLDAALNDLAFDPRTPDTIYAASTGGGLMRLRFAR